MTLHVIVAPTAPAAIAYCERNGLPTGRYDRSKLPDRVEFVTPHNQHSRLQCRSGPVKVHDILGPDDPPLPARFKRDLAQLLFLNGSDDSPADDPTAPEGSDS